MKFFASSVSSLKYRLRGLYLRLDALLWGQSVHVELPNGKRFKIHTSSRDKPDFKTIVTEEMADYWTAHRPQPEEVHLDVGAQIGLYTLLAASSGARVYSFEPDPNNRRLLLRNLRDNHLEAHLIEKGVWNDSAVLPWRSQSAQSSVPGVGMLPTDLTAIDHIEVDTLDNLVSGLNLNRIDVLKMDIEGAEVEAIQGAAETIKKYRPLLMIEAYHIRDGAMTTDRVLTSLRTFGIPDSCIQVTEKTMIVASGY